MAQGEYLELEGGPSLQASADGSEPGKENGFHGQAQGTPPWRIHPEVLVPSSLSMERLGSRPLSHSRDAQLSTTKITGAPGTAR